MNYRHAYHAGNFADVIKHVSLIGLLQSLSKKPTAFCYLETHAGAGVYHLASLEASKTKEYETGVVKVLAAKTPPLWVDSYLDCIQRINEEKASEPHAELFYPGSVLIARYQLRDHDKIIACELHAEEFQKLQNQFRHDKQVHIHCMDGYLGLKAFLPPVENRGLVFIDPPYEAHQEWSNLANKIIPSLLKRWTNGIFAIWYPLKDKTTRSNFYNSLKHLNRPTLLVECTIYPESPSILSGSGLAIIQPPWQFDQIITPTLAWLWQTLSSQEAGGYRVEWL